MAGGNFFSDNKDIQFHLKHSVDPKELFQSLSQADKEVVSATTAKEYMANWSEVLETLGEICGSQLVANAEQVDREGYKLKEDGFHISPALQENLSTLQEFGIGAYGVSSKYDGMGAPFLMEMMSIELMNQACPSTCLSVSWYSSIAHIIEQFGDDELKQKFIPPMAAGEWSGNMALTEPDAGSDLSAMRTYGEKQEDGTFKLYGTKHFITNGVGEISLVLAKNEKGSKGLKSLSLFLCPRHINGKENIKITKLEDKPGLRGSATAELVYDGAEAYILGKEGEGFSYMLNLMNAARIGVAFQGIGLMEATFQLATDYAANRKTWGKAIAKHEQVHELLTDMELELRATRSLAYKAAYETSLLILAEKRLKHEKLKRKERSELEEKAARWRRRSRRFTPLLKYWVGEKSFAHARTAVQILGGYGYTNEYKAEWWVRESMIYSLYEGTSQIQSLMCVKDILKDVVRDPKSFVETTVDLKVQGLTSKSDVRKKYIKLRQISQSAVTSILLKLIKAHAASSFESFSGGELIKMVRKLSKELVQFKDISPALLHAERICHIKSLESLSWALVKDFEADEKRKAYADKFLDRAVAKAQYLKSLIDTDDSAFTL